MKKLIILILIISFSFYSCGYREENMCDKQEQTYFSKNSEEFRETLKEYYNDSFILTPFYSDCDDEITYATNAMYDMFGVVNPVPGYTDISGNSEGSLAVHKYGGNTGKYFEWLVSKWCWNSDAIDLYNWYKELIKNYPMAENGFPWSWSTRPTWTIFNDYPGFQNCYHFDDIFRYVNAICEICAWEGNINFLNEIDGTTTQFPDEAWKIPKKYKDVSCGMTVAQKYEKLMNYALEILDGKNGLIVIDNGLNTGTLGSATSNYFDNYCYGYKSAYENMLFYEMLHNASELEFMRDNKEKANEYLELADIAKQKYNETFWDTEKGRYINCIDINGEKWDFGVVPQNLEAISSGLANAEQSKLILDWIDGEREIQGDTITGKDSNGISCVYKYQVAPRTNTVALENKYEIIGDGTYQNERRKNFWTKGNYWPTYDAFTGKQRPANVPCIYADGNAGFDQIQVNGGLLFWTSYYDLMARIKINGADNMANRLQAIATEYGKDRLLRKPKNDFGAGWKLGIIGEFPESGLVPMAYLHGILGITANSKGLVINPHLPVEYDFAGTDKLRYCGKNFDVSVWKDGSIKIKALNGYAGKVVIPTDKSCKVTICDENEQVLTEMVCKSRQGNVIFDMTTVSDQQIICIKKES